MNYLAPVGGGTLPKLDTGTCRWTGYLFWVCSPTQGKIFFKKSHVGYRFQVFRVSLLKTVPCRVPFFKFSGYLFDKKSQVGYVISKNFSPTKGPFLNFQRHVPVSPSVEYPSPPGVTSKTQCEEFGSLIGQQDYVTLSIPVFSLR